MNICRSQFGWQCAQLKKKRMRSVGPGLTPRRVGSAVAGSAVVGSAVVGSAAASFSTLVPPQLCLQALVPMVQRQPHR